MSKLKRFSYLLSGLLGIAMVVIMIALPDEGYDLIFVFVSFYLVVYSINQLLYYFTLARYMVGGSMILCKALIALSLAIEVGYLTELPEYYVMIYLVAGLIFSGLVDVLKSFETKKNGGRKWELKLCQGVATILISIAGLFFVYKTNIVIYFFCAGALASSFTKIAEAFKKTSVVYIK